MWKQQCEGLRLCPTLRIFNSVINNKMKISQYRYQYMRSIRKWCNVEVDFWVMIQIRHRCVTIPIAYSKIIKQMPCYSFRDHRCNSFDRSLQTADINSVHYGKRTSNRFQFRLLSFPQHNAAIKLSIMDMHTLCLTSLYNRFQIWIQH